MPARRVRKLPVAILSLALVVLTGCTSGTIGPTPSDSPSSSSSPSPSPTPSPSPAEGRVTHDWAWPGPGQAFVTVNHDPPPPPLLCLIRIEASSHPDGSPAYDQMSFVFDGAFPSYDIEYVDEIIMDGSGDVVELPGSHAMLRVLFRHTQAHDEQGRSCVESAPDPILDFPALEQYADAGDYEGVVTFGLGIGTEGAPGDPRSEVRVEEVENVRDGETEYVVVVKIDAEPWLQQ